MMNVGSECVTHLVQILDLKNHEHWINSSSPISRCLFFVQIVSDRRGMSKFEVASNSANSSPNTKHIHSQKIYVKMT